MVTHNGTIFDNPFLFSNFEYYNFVPKIPFMFHLHILKLAKLVIPNIPDTFNFKLKLFLSYLQ